MPRIYSQTVNAVQMLSIAPAVDMAAGTMNVTATYIVGVVAPGRDFVLISGAANAASAMVSVPLSTSLAATNQQLQYAIAQQEGLVLSQSVDAVRVTAGGSGYSAPTVTFSAPQMEGGTAATGTVVLAGDIVSAITVTHGGSGYLSPPTVTIVDAVGSGAAAVAVMGADVVIPPS